MNELPELQGAALRQRVHDELVRQFGPMLPSSALCKALGYPSAGAYRQAVARGTVPVPVFRIQNRRGRFALALDVADWMCRQRNQAVCVTASKVNPT